MKPFDPHAATRADWAAIHAFRRARHDEDEPGEPFESDEEFEHGARRHWPLYQNRRWTAQIDGEISGVLGVGFRRVGTEGYEDHAPHVQVWGSVRKAWRRRGVATVLQAFMVENDKTVATFWTRNPDGHAFLQAIGAELKHRGIQNRLQFASLDWPELARWHQAAIPPDSGLAWEIHAGRVPIDRFEAVIPQINQLFEDVPMGTLDSPPIRWEIEGLRTYYEELDRHGGAHYLVLLMDGATIAALCEASWDARYPKRVYQNLTATARQWRGRGLAKGVKAAMLKLIRQRHPDIELMITGNAEVNAPMLSINHRLGFTEYKRDGSYQIRLDALSAWLQQRG